MYLLSIYLRIPLSLSLSLSLSLPLSPSLSLESDPVLGLPTRLQYQYPYDRGTNQANVCYYIGIQVDMGVTIV